MTCSVRILSTTSVDSSPAILLVAPNGDKILVNCGEGCQRVFLEFSQKLSTVHRICLTHLSHSTLAGLPGMILTSADVATASAVAQAKQKAVASGNNESKLQPQHQPTPKRTVSSSSEEHRPGLDIIGPVGIEAFVHSLRHFMRREAFDLRLHPGEYFQRRPPEPSAKRRKPSSKTNTKNRATEEVDFHIQSIAIHDNQGSNRQVLSYIFTTPPIQGKFQLDKAKELGIPLGPLYGQLKAGKAVTFVDSETGKERRVESHEVVEPGSPGVAVAILYYPNLGVFKSLQESAFLSKLLPNNAQSNTDQSSLELILHITSKDCFESAQCAEWREGLGSAMQHIFVNTDLPQANDEDPGTPFHSASAGATYRSKLSGDIFVAPISSPQPDPPETLDASTNVVKGVPLLEYIIIPRSKKGFLNHHAYQEHKKQVDQLVASLLETSGAIDLAQQLTADSGNGNIYPHGELIFTGTGSAIPCKHRNVSGIYLQMANRNAILLDIGEGTLGQLLRVKHQEDHLDVLRRIRAVWISHPHADHHLGILRLLAERQALLGVQEEPVIVIAPQNLIRFLKEYERVDPHVAGSYVVLDCLDIVAKSTMQRHQKIHNRLQSELGITAIQSIPVQHCAHSYAVELKGTSFGTVAYSGDCRPSRSFAEAAQSADVLIHEATFMDGMEAEASLKRHSTVGEALEVASTMKAKNVVLTHFSQRYPKIPPVSARNGTVATEADIPVVFAFDFMKLTPCNLKAASKITPALRLLYPDQAVVDEDDSSADIAVDSGALDVPGLFAQNELL